MREAEWIPLELLVWPCHDLDPAHLHPAPGIEVTTGPISVERLRTGHYFVHDGRHRAIRALERGDQSIEAWTDEA